MAYELPEEALQRENEEFLRSFVELVNSHPGPLIDLVLMPDTAFYIMTALQCALRHPRVATMGLPREVIEETARAIADSFPEPIRARALRGFDARFDLDQAEI